MSLKKTLEDALKQAMKNKDNVKRNALRLCLSTIKLAEVDTGKPLDDTAIMAILQKEIKTKGETISEAEKAGRNEMIAPIQAEIDYLKEFLPQALSDEELKSLVDGVISETGASSIKEMGKVMKMAIEKVAGRAANDRISKMVREVLSGN